MTSAVSTPGAAALAYRQFRFWTTFSRRTVRGTVMSAVLFPLLYLTAMGLGLGTLVNGGRGLPGGVSYVAFVAPGVLAATAMQGAFGEATYPVLGSIKWAGNYWAALNTPQQPKDVLAGHAAFILLRITGMSAVFFGFAAAFGTVRGPEGLLALPAAVLTGAAFTFPIMAYVITLDIESPLNVLFRFVMTPLFLFSGTFFPWQQLPAWAHPFAYATPLWHGVQLCRGFTLGTETWPDALMHTGYLLLWTVGGYIAARITFERRLHK